MALEVARGDGAPVENEPGNVEPGQRHNTAGNGFIAADQND